MAMATVPEEAKFGRMPQKLVLEFMAAKLCGGGGGGKKSEMGVEGKSLLPTERVLCNISSGFLALAFFAPSLAT